MEEERCYTVYMHICKETGKTYVGITGQKPKNRWGNGLGYKTYKNNENYFYNAIKKHGWENFEHILLFQNKTKEEAERLEILYINILLSNNRTYGYNIANGGNYGGKHSKETKLKLRESNRNIAPKVICDNKIFNGVSECGEYYKINSDRMGDWLRGNRRMPVEFFNLGLKYLDSEVELKPNLDGRGYSKRVICEEIVFKSITECANHYNINPHTMRDWLSGSRKMRNDFYEKGLRFLDEGNSHLQPQNKYHRSKNVICDDITFDSIKDCSEYYGINVSTMSSWLNAVNSMPKSFLDLGLKYLDDEIKLYKVQTNSNKRQVICNGIIFNSINQCAKFYNIKRQLLNDWLLNPHRIPQQFKDMGLDYYIEN